MDQLTKNLNDINDAMKKLIKKKISPDEAGAVSRLAMAAHAHVMSNFKIAQAIEKPWDIGKVMQGKGLYSSHDAVVVEEPGLDKVICPVTGKVMIKNECMDEMENDPEKCEGCEIGAETKRLLLPPRE